MDWTKIDWIIRIGRWVKKQVDADRKERHAAAMVRDVARREKEVEELIELKNDNIERLPDLISLEGSISYSFRTVKTAQIRFLITNCSIFDVTLHKFTARPLYEGQNLADISDPGEHKITKQARYYLSVTYNLQEAIAKEIDKQDGKAYWQFETHAYFHSEFREFEKEQTVTIHTPKVRSWP